jgi:hypothetical protein
VNPDWRDPATYPDPKSTRLTQWAWEFLRRNPDYRSDWRRYAESCAVLRAKHRSKLDADQEPTAFAFDHDDPLGCVYEPPREDGESEGGWLRRVGSGSSSPLGSWLCKKWGIGGAGGLPEPTAIRFPGLWAASAGLVRMVASRPEGSAVGTSTVATIEFDLSRPLEPQFAAAKRLLTRRQTYLRQRGVVGTSTAARAQSGVVYRRYLRALDAVETGAKLTHIAQVLFPTDPDPEARRDKARATIRAAKQLRDGGYRRLPSLSARTRTGK